MLQLQFERLKMKETKTIDQFMTKVSSIDTNFQTNNGNLEQMLVVQ